MALLEHTSYDRRTGAPINSNLADYVVAVNADVPPIAVHFLDFPDMGDQRPGGRGGSARSAWPAIAAAITDAVAPCDGRSRAGAAGEDRALAGVTLMRSHGHESRTGSASL